MFGIGSAPGGAGRQRRLAYAAPLMAVIFVACCLTGCRMQTHVGVRSEPEGAGVFAGSVNAPEVVPVRSILGDGRQAVTNTNIMFDWNSGTYDRVIKVKWPDGTHSDSVIIKRYSRNKVVTFRKGRAAEVEVFTGHDQTQR